MSTKSDNAADGTPPNNVNIPRQPTLPSFAPVREQSSSHGGSSVSSSRKSQTESRSPSNLRLSVSAEDGQAKLPNGAPQNGTVRRPNRSSGGFLIDFAAQQNSLSRSLLSQRDTKGKRKNDDNGISIQKRRQRGGQSDYSPGIRSSPLSAENKAVQHDGSEARTGSGSFRSGMDSQPESYTRSQDGKSALPGPPPVGYDTDPAQIVDMALRLSEGRRRQASAKRLVSGGTVGHRIVSSAPSVGPRGRAPSTSMSQYLNAQRKPSARVSVLPQSPRQQPINSIEENEFDSPLSPPAEECEEEEEELEISRATATRVARARTYFELAYEHRRLLSHLPPIRSPHSLTGPQTSDQTSKVYNPLQYARNRKLRFRERNPIEAEATGWHDVEKVRTWVDAVTKSHNETRHDPEECVRLPPLNSDKENVSDNEPDLSPKTSRPMEQKQNKLRRPRSDWVTHPGDMIADAFWLEQGLNKTKIYDRDNKAIYPADTKFKFSGWRNRTPVEVPQIFQSPEPMQEPTPPPEAIKEKEPAPNPAHRELPKFQSAQRGGQRRGSKFMNALARAEGGSGRKGLGIFESSSEESSPNSSDSDAGKETRGRKRSSRKREKFNLLDGDPFSQSPNNRKAISRLKESPGSNKHSPRSSKRGSIDHSKLTDYLKRTGSQNNSSQDKHERRGNSGKRTLLNSVLAHENDKPRSSYEYDTTAPNSPSPYQFPSISINLSPPPSRSPSPTKKRNSVFEAVKGAIHHSRERVEITDFADLEPKHHSRNASREPEKREDSSRDHSRGTSPMTRSSVPPILIRQDTHDDIWSGAPDLRSGTVSKVNSRATDSGYHSHRIRGMFKGGRIAELVGNEVSRVGDYIWKRDPPRLSSSNASTKSGYQSDSEEEGSQNGEHIPHPRKMRPSTASTNSSYHESPTSSTISRSVTNSPEQQHHQYNNPNLPSFTSPFQRDKAEQDRRQTLLTPKGSLEQTRGTDDHISRQAAQHRSVSKSPRLDRLAPPKLDTSAPRNTDADRRNSYGFGSALDLSRPKSASQLYNQAINQATEGGSTAASTNKKFSFSVVDEMNQKGIKVPDRITKSDITRVHALLMMSAIKADNVANFANAVPDAHSRFFLDTITANHKPQQSSKVPFIRRKEEHVFAARSIIATLTEHSSKFNDLLDSFSHTTAPNLHKEIQILEDKVENTLTRSVRISADRAGELSMKLTTTSALAVKGLNDQIGEAMRYRRRGPVKWVRRFGFKMVEWAVVGLLWGIWFIVTVIRIMLGSVRFVVRIARWLTWFD